MERQKRSTSVYIPFMPEIKPFTALMPSKEMQSQAAWDPLLHPHDVRQAQLIGRQFDESPCIYVYRVVHHGSSQLGLWALTSINDYTSGKIKKHELTILARENSLADYLMETDLDANPVLLTYTPNELVDELTTRYVSEDPALDHVFDDGSRHFIWRVTSPDDIKVICDTFHGMQSVYIADGHHRAASMAKVAVEKRRQNSGKHTGLEPYNYFSSVYMNTDEVQVFEYNRLVRDLGHLSPEQFLLLLSASFQVSTSKNALKPEKQQQICMYLLGKWYNLEPLPGIIDQEDVVAGLGVSILQDCILDPILHITDPRTNPRLAFESGLTSIKQLEALVNGGTFQIAFVLAAVPVLQLIKVADAKGIMPPKSTWVEPKFPVGLLMTYFGLDYPS